MAERQGIEIDYCPQCRGIWLDRGELEKLIERSYAPINSYQQQERQNFPNGHNQRDQHNQYNQHEQHEQHEQQRYGKEHHGDDHGYGQNGQHRKKSWLSELFD